MLGGECCEVGARRGEDVADERGPVEQQPARGCGSDGGSAAGPVQKRRSDDRLERGDLARERGLRVAERCCGRSERPEPGGDLERGKVPYFEPPPRPIDISDHDDKYRRFDRSHGCRDAWAPWTLGASGTCGPSTPNRGACWTTRRSRSRTGASRRLPRHTARHPKAPMTGAVAASFPRSSTVIRT